MPKLLPIALVKQIAARASEAAANIPCSMSIAVVDSGANLVYLERMDGALLASVEVAQKKARSAVLYSRPTKAFEDMLVGGRMAVLTLPHAMPLEGGIPLLREGKLAGAIGVSGGTAQQDGAVANAAVEAFAAIAVEKTL
jgi:glc operon protein GlcG